MNDEQAIRDLVQQWMALTRAGDTASVLELMTDDVVFLVPGQEPIGKEQFRAASAGMGGVRFDGVSEIEEVHVAGDWGWLRTRLHVTATWPGGKVQRRSGRTLTIVRKSAAGRWQVARDANLLVAIPD